MIKKIAKIIGIAVGVIIAIAISFYTYCYVDIRLRMNRTYSIEIEPIEISYDSATIALGERLSRIRACRDCHGHDLGGASLANDFLIGNFVSKNITKGKGGLPEDFSATDWVRAIKHGLDNHHRPLKIMPSNELSLMTEKDMAAIIAYCTQVPNVDREHPPFRIGPMSYILAEFDLIPMFPAEKTDHSLSFAKEVKREVSVAYGKYLSTICVNCHGPNMKGSKSPIPGGKDRPDITSTGKAGKWTHEQFATTLQTGVTPEGNTLSPEMPWGITKNYSKDELTALHMYLLTLK